MDTQKKPKRKNAVIRHRTGKMALRNKTNPLCNLSDERSCWAWALNCGRTPCTPTDEFTIVRSKDLRGFKNLGGLVDIIDVTRAERLVLSVAE